MSLKEKSMFLGLGCYGGKQAKEFITIGYKGNAANGSAQDLKALSNIPVFHLTGFDGFGGHREKALDCLARNEDFLKFVENIEEEIVFLLFGGGGSTGSGCGTILADMLLRDKDDEGKPRKIVCPIIALPSSDEATKKHMNAYDTVRELQELEGLGATFFINNNIQKDYSSINSTFTRLLDTFLSDDSYGELNNFDESERMEMLRDGGAMVLSLMKSGTEASIMLEKLTKNGIFAPIEPNKICEHIGIIHAGNDNRDIESSIVISEVGKPRNIFEGYNSRRTLISVSGLDFPVSHVSKLGNLAKSAYEERKRDRKQVKKLGNLDFIDDEVNKKTAQEKKVPSKFELLQKRMKK